MILAVICDRLTEVSSDWSKFSYGKVKMSWGTKAKGNRVSLLPISSVLSAWPVSWTIDDEADFEVEFTKEKLQKGLHERAMFTAADGMFLAVW